MISLQHLPAGATIVSVQISRVTAATVPALKAAIAAVIASGHHRLIIDMEGVSFLDSSGLGAMVGLLKLVGSRGDVVVCSLQPSVDQMFRLTRMDKVFRIFHDADAAGASLEQV
jgi:anti-sigma B factor antagonist